MPSLFSFSLGCGRSQRCEVCEYCGEQYFEAKVLKRIEKDFDEIHYKGKKAKKELTLPVEEYEEIRF